MSLLKPRARSRSRFVVLFVIAVLFMQVGPIRVGRVAAADLSIRSVKLSDATAAQGGVKYGVEFKTGGAQLIGSIRVQFCSNSPIVNDVCLPPAGFSAAGAGMDSQFGITGFTISSSSTANDIILTRPPAMQSAATAEYNFSNITNPLSGGSYFVRLFTYPTSDGSGAYTDSGGVALYYASSLGVLAEVPPFLRFCLGGNITDLDCSTATDPSTDLGRLGTDVTGLAQSQMLAVTNVESGYSLWVTGTTMTSGNNILPPMEGGASEPGVSQFGINLRANNNPVIGQDAAGPGAVEINDDYNHPNIFRFNPGDLLASSQAPTDYLKYTVSYVVNVGPDQPGGVYATTLTYIALPNF